jgi:3-oxoacyl-[acyl-carrier-protein] synthase I
MMAIASPPVLPVSRLAMQSFGAVTLMGHSCTQTLASWVGQVRRLRKVKLAGFADPFTVAECFALTEGMTGAERLQALLTSAVLEAIEGEVTLNAASPGLGLLVLPSWVTESQQLQLQAHFTSLMPRSERPHVLFKGGTTAALDALVYAHDAAQRDPSLQRISLAVVSSECEPGVLNAAARAGWLLKAGNGQGYVPGEAAACVVLSPLRQAKEIRDWPSSRFVLHRPFTTKHTGRWWPSDSVPLHTAVTDALAGALQNASMTGAHISHLLSDMDGSDWRAHLEAAALDRTVFKDAQSRLPHWMPADLLGQTGAAMNLLGWMLAARTHAHDIERINTVLSWVIDPAGFAGAVVMERSPN